MGEILRKRIKQTRFESPVQEALLNLTIAANYIREEAERTLEPHGVTGAQYNVLRILRGVHPEGHPRGEIAQRMLDRAPDVTRLIDRLEEKGLVARDRTSQDRRHSMTRISDAGLALVEQIQPVMKENFKKLRKRLSDEDCEMLSRICEQIYGPDVDGE